MPSIRRRIAPFDDVPIVFTSVLNKQRILDVLQTAMNVYYARIRRIPTSALNEYLLPIIEQTPPPSTKGEYRSAVESCHSTGFPDSGFRVLRRICGSISRRDTVAFW